MPLRSHVTCPLLNAPSPWTAQQGDHSVAICSELQWDGQGAWSTQRASDTEGTNQSQAIYDDGVASVTLSVNLE